MQTINEASGDAQIAQSYVIMQDLLDRFISFIGNKPKTIKTYYRAVRQFIRYLQNNGIKQPCRMDVLAFRDSLKTFCKPSTIQIYIIAVRLFFKWTASEGLYSNIADHINGVKLDRGYKKGLLDFRTS